MNIPGYDAWRLQGPADDRCPECDGHKKHDCWTCGGKDDDCPDCEGAGEVECETCAEPDGDYAYEQYRDRQMEERE